MGLLYFYMTSQYDVFQVTFFAEGVFHHIICSLPRQPDPHFNSLIEQIRSSDSFLNYAGIRDLSLTKSVVYGKGTNSLTSATTFTENQVGANRELSQQVSIYNEIYFYHSGFDESLGKLIYE